MTKKHFSGAVGGTVSLRKCRGLADIINDIFRTVTCYGKTMIKNTVLEAKVPRFVSQLLHLPVMCP